MKKIVKGNDFTLRIPVKKQVDGMLKPFPLPACTDIVVRLCSSFSRIELSYEIDIEQDNILLAKVEGDKVPMNTYGIEVKGKIFGNDWRSREYPQIAIVGDNADADFEFGETDEGDNSVEVDTAIVILPPTVELSKLIVRSQESLDSMKALNDSVSAEEINRVDSENKRVIAENERDKSENERNDAEEKRIVSENIRIYAENNRVNAETERSDAEAQRNVSEDNRMFSETERKTNEKERISNETERNNAESIRNSNENKRIEAEDVRMLNENERMRNEESRKYAETQRQKTLIDTVSSVNIKVNTFVGKAQSDIDTAINDVNTETNKAINIINEHKDAIDKAESERVKAEKKREEIFVEMKESSDEATSNAISSSKNADDSAEMATKAANKADIAAENAKVATDNANDAADNANAIVGEIITYDCSKKGTVISGTLEKAINSVAEPFRKGGLVILFIGDNDLFNMYLCRSKSFSTDVKDWISILTVWG